MRTMGNAHKWLRLLGAATAVAIAATGGGTALEGQAQQAGAPMIQSLTEPGQGLEIRRTSAESGFVAFAASQSGGVRLPTPPGASAEERALTFVDFYGLRFGLADRTQARPTRAPFVDGLGTEHVRLQQLHRGVPVTAGELVVHMIGARVTSANGHVLGSFPDNMTPTITAESARQGARELLEKHRPANVQGARYSEPRLEVFSRGMLEHRVGWPSRLAWFVEATGPELREFIWIDASDASVLLSFSQLAHGKNRLIYTANNGTALPGSLARSEAGPATGNSDQDNAYNFAGLTYDYFFSNHGRDSFDGLGGALISTTQYSTNFQNAFWNGIQMVYGDGYASADDVVAHELTHGVTEHSAGLFYFMQSGALNESFSDVFGEAIDLIDGVGDDSEGIRWQIGEDLPGGSIRDMRYPNTFGDPSKMSDARYFDCDPNVDEGGVHGNSAIPNHAFVLMVDGGTFNGQTITGIGLTKAAAIQYRALTIYLTPAASFLDHADALKQSCADLVGTSGITAFDCTQVANAIDAVEMDESWGCYASAPTAALCPGGGSPGYVASFDFENSAAGWVTTSTGTGSWSWQTLGARGSARSLFGSDPVSPSDHWAAMAASVVVPANGRLAFDHWFGFESDGLGHFDGGVVEYSTNGGATWQTNAGELMDGGRKYKGSIATGYGNPLGGRAAFSGGINQFERTRLDLSTLAGQSVRFRFRIGSDSSVGATGWFIDNVAIYTCLVQSGAPVISSAPQSQTLAVGATASLTVVAAGDAPLSYQWLKDGSVLSGATQPTLTLVNVQGLDAGSYSVIVTNGAGSASPDAALLTVLTPGVWSGVTSQGLPFNFTLSPSAQVVSPLYYEFEFGCFTGSTTVGAQVPVSGNQVSYSSAGLVLTGTFSSARTIFGTGAATFGPPCGGTYMFAWSASAGAPTITTQPANQIVAVGGSAGFSVGVLGNPTPSIQWQVSTNGGESWANLSNDATYGGVSTSNLSISNVQAGLNGALYRVIATNAAGSATSHAGTLTVNGGSPTPPGPPTAVTAIAGNAQASVSFTPPINNGGSPITGYTVTSNPAGGVDTNAGSTSTTHVVTGLTNGTGYTFTVVATNAIGSSTPSVASNTVTPSAAPPGPFSHINPSDGATAVSASPVLTWGASSGAASYEYCIDAVNNSACDASWTSAGANTNAGLSGLTPSTTYYWHVRASNTGGVTYAEADSAAYWSFTTAEAQDYQLTISKMGTGSGTVTSAPAGIDCGSTCSSTFSQDQVVTLTATPGAGSVFNGFGGDADCIDGQITMSSPRTCTATFTAGSSSGPVSPLYLTGTRFGGGLPSVNTIRVVHGTTVVNSWPATGGYETALAVTSSVKALGGTVCSGGCDGVVPIYTASYSLAGAAAGTAALGSVPMASPSQRDYLYDGTTDGTHHYALGMLTNNVYRFDANWENATVLFTVGSPGGLLMGISYDPDTDSLWVSGYNTVAVRNYSMTGILLGSFSLLSEAGGGAGLGLGLALDTADDTLWIGRYSAAEGHVYQQYSKQGALLGWMKYPNMQDFESSGAEFALTPGAVPSAFGKSSPANGAMAISSTVMLSWTASGGATSYEYCIDTTNDGTCNSTWIPVGNVTSVAAAGLASATTHYWQVRASNNLGAAYADGNATTFWTFTTGRSPFVDLNGDGDGDVLTYDPVTGAWARQVSQPGGGFSVAATGSWAPGWSILPAHFDTNGLTDFFLFNTATGQWSKMLNDGTGFTTQASGGWWPDWQRFAMDLDGDGTTDFFLYDPATGVWFKCASTPDGFTYQQGGWNPGWELYPMRLNDDAFGDLFLINRTTGRWFWVTGEAGPGFGYPVTETWFAGWQFYPGDFDGDGLGDILLHDPPTGIYFVATNSGSGFTYVQGGWSLGWQPYVADFNADGRDDLFLHDPGTGVWFEMLSDGLGSFTNAGGQTWSLGWTIFPTDLNSDGRADIVLYDPVTGAWYQARNLVDGAFTYNSGAWTPGLTLVARTPIR
jgi:bacillolysin